MTPFITELEKLNNPAYENSQYVDNDTLHILFVNPEATGANFYKIFAPYQLLKYTKVVETALCGWRKYNPVKRFRNEDKVPISSNKIRWADSMVIPFTNDDITRFMQDCRLRQDPSRVGLRIIYHIDFDFYNIPDKHPLKDAFTPEKVANVEKNLLFADSVICTSMPLLTSIVSRLRESGEEIPKDKFLCQFPTVDTDLFLGENKPITEKDKEYFNLVVIAGDNQILDLQPLIPMLKEVKKKHGKAVKVIIFGVNRNKNGFEKMVKGLEYIPVGAVPIWKYYSQLIELNPDLVVIPSDKSEFSLRSNDSKRWIDCAMLNIPTISPVESIADVRIEHGVNGYEYADGKKFLETIDELVADKSKAFEVGKVANDLCEKNFSYTTEKLQRLLNLLG